MMHDVIDPEILVKLPSLKTQIDEGKEDSQAQAIASILVATHSDRNLLNELHTLAINADLEMQLKGDTSISGQSDCHVVKMRRSM